MWGQLLGVGLGIAGLILGGSPKGKAESVIPPILSCNIADMPSSSALERRKGWMGTGLEISFQHPLQKIYARDPNQQVDIGAVAIGKDGNSTKVLTSRVNFNPNGDPELFVHTRVPGGGFLPDGSRVQVIIGLGDRSVTCADEVVVEGGHLQFAGPGPDITDVSQFTRPRS